jgi:thiosulfate/3-mercaptopyruvate sulfurtransferase
MQYRPPALHGGWSDIVAAFDPSRQEPRMHSTLITASELAGALDGGDIVVCDCRHDLLQPGWGREQYLAGHIPGAVYVDLGADLSGPPLTDHGRHPMPSAQALEAVFSRLGIAAGQQVVAYDQRDGSIAARLWWLLRYMGHDAVAVLDGGYPAWLAAGLPQRAGDEARAPARFHGTARSDRVVVIEDLPTVARLIDARAAARYRGEVEPIDPVAGHIPGARSLPFSDNLDAQGRFLAPQRVRARLLEALDGVAPGEAVFACGSGVTACHLALASAWAGLDDGRIYVGSFSEWCRDGTRAVATGPEPGSL